MIIEKSFPRGGVPSKESKQTVNKKDNIVFGAFQTKVKKTKSKTINEFDNLYEKDDVIETHTAELLSYDTVQDGMNIMGMVTAVDQLYVTISLPGRMIARISALEISDAYTKAAKEFLESAEQAGNFKTLQELYNIGQLVYGLVKEVKQNQFGRTELVMSLKPAEVHAELIHTNVRKGFTFNGAIEEVQEHGYIIETGIKGLRTFLPIDKSQKELAIGQLVYLKVEKITNDKTVSTCICKQVSTEQLNIKSKQSDPIIDYILPATIVKFQVTKCLKNGLQGTIMDEAFTAYVNEHQLSEPLMLPEDYEIKSKYDARILYVMPLTKLVYLTMNLKQTKNENENVRTCFQRGDIIENAKVHHFGTGGVVLVLSNSLKGLISYKTIKANYKGNYDQDELLSKYAKQSKHKVRVLAYDMMDSLYICTDDVNVVNEKNFNLNDVKSGEFVTATIKSYNKKIDGYNAQIGKINAIIERMFLAPTSRQYEAKTKIRCRVINVDIERRTAYLTNRSEYLTKNCKILTNLEEARKHEIFMGTIIKATHEYYLVRFFNNIAGMLFKNHIRDFLQNDHNMNFSEGQTMLFRIWNRNGERISLALVDDICRMGEICTATVTQVLETGLEIDVRHKTTAKKNETSDVDEEEEEENKAEFSVSKGLVPLRLLSDFIDLLHAKLKIYNIKTELQTVCMHKNIFSVRDVAYFQAHGVKPYGIIQPGDILRAYVENVNDDVIELFVPIIGYNKLIKIHLNMLLMQAYKKSNVVLHPEQVVYVKVLSMEPITKTITITAQLTEVWDQTFSSVSDYVESYLKEITEIRKELKKKHAHIANYSIGDKIDVHFRGIDTETKDWHYEDKTKKLMVIAKATLMSGPKIKPPKEGTKQEAIILWIDYSNDILLISPKAGDIKHITKSTKLPEDLTAAKNVNAKVLLKLEHVFICSLKKGPNPLIYCPIHLHYNDFEMSASLDIEEGDFCKLAFIHKSKPIAVLQTTFDTWQHRKKTMKRQADKSANQIEINKNEPLAKKFKKQGNTEKSIMTSNKTSKDKDKEEANIKKAKRAKLETPHDSLTKKLKKDELLFFEDTTPHIPKPKFLPSQPKSLAGVNDFWTTDLSQLEKSNNAESTDDDVDDDANSLKATEAAKQKKKKLSTVEKFKQQRLEESHLREIEEKYADPNHLPETVDQFDRLVLSEPNNSKNWINYMVFHLQSAEIDKARAIAKRAVKAISMRNIDDHLNIWVALLNLELRYGSRESFDSTLKEALTYNEPLKVYLRVVEILREAKKNQELIEIVNVITKKFKTKQEVWKAAADAYFNVGMTDQAQQMLHKSLASLPEREHVNTIVMFANLNHRHGCQEMAQTLLDQVVTSYPKRVDVWTQYVDMLVKDELIDSARNVLERAILQKIPLKKMRIIFKKYLEFEEQHGSEADVEKVKRLATEYVKNNANVEV